MKKLAIILVSALIFVGACSTSEDTTESTTTRPAREIPVAPANPTSEEDVALQAVITTMESEYPELRGNSEEDWLELIDIACDLGYDADWDPDVIVTGIAIVIETGEFTENEGMMLAGLMGSLTAVYPILC